MSQCRTSVVNLLMTPRRRMQRRVVTVSSVLEHRSRHTRNIRTPMAAGISEIIIRTCAVCSDSVGIAAAAAGAHSSRQHNRNENGRFRHIPGFTWKRVSSGCRCVAASFCLWLSCPFAIMTCSRITLRLETVYDDLALFQAKRPFIQEYIGHTTSGLLNLD